jgi:hypothetical protein
MSLMDKGVTPSERGPCNGSHRGVPQAFLVHGRTLRDQPRGRRATLRFNRWTAIRDGMNRIVGAQGATDVATRNRIPNVPAKEVLGTGGWQPLPSSPANPRREKNPRDLTSDLHRGGRPAAAIARLPISGRSATAVLNL